MAEDSPPFLLFLPPKLGAGSVWAGSTVPPSAKPTRHGEVTAGPCHRLPSRVVAGGWSIAGKRAWSCLSRAHRAQGRKEGPFRTETTYHPRSPVTNQGRRGGKSPALGFLLLMSRDVPAARVGQSPEPWCGAVGGGRDAPTATGCCTKETLLLCEVPLENRLTPKVTLGRWEPSLGLRPGGWEGFPRGGEEEGVLRTSLPPAAPPPGPCRQESSHSGWWWPSARQVCCRPRPRLVPPSRALGGCWGEAFSLGESVPPAATPQSSCSKPSHPLAAPHPGDRSHRRQRAAPGARSATVSYPQNPL